MPLPGNGQGFFTLTKDTLISCFLALPVILITITGFLSTTTSSVGIILLFLGQVFLVPFVQLILGFLRGIGSIQNVFGLSPPLTYNSISKLCALSPVDVKNDDIVPSVSYWLAHSVFFASYIATNAITLFASKSDKKQGEENRIAHAMTAFIVTGILFALMIGAHYLYVGCDTPGSLALSIALYAPLGILWFKFAEVCGLKAADVLGIASMINSVSDNNSPYACVNIKTN